MHSRASYGRSRTSICNNSFAGSYAQATIAERIVHTVGNRFVLWFHISQLMLRTVMTCIALSLLNLLQPVFVELLGLVFDHQSLYAFFICLKVVVGDPLSTTFEQVSKIVVLHPFLVLRAFPSFNGSLLGSANKLVALCVSSRERLCSLCNNILDYGLLVTKPTFLTDTSTLIENPFKEKQEDVEETKGRKLSPFMRMVVDVFTGNSSSEETLKLVKGLQLLLVINLLCLAFSVPINGEYLDNKLSRFYVLWLQKWVETTLNFVRTKHNNKEEKNSFLFKDSTVSWEREKVFLAILFTVLLLCCCILYALCLIK